MIKFLFILVVSMVCVSLTPVHPKQTEVGLTQQKLNLAKRIYEQVVAPRNSAQIDTSLVEDGYVWSVRVLESSEDQVSALDGHLKRMLDIQTRVDALDDYGRVSPEIVDIARFYVVEAQHWKLKGRR